MTTTRDYSLVGPEGRRAVEAGLSRAVWYQTPVPRKRLKELMQRSDRRALLDTALWLGLLLVSGAAGAWLWPSWWCVVPFFVYGTLYGSASDARWHECGHGTAFRTPWMNTVVYHLACFMIVRSPTAWRWSHVRHHTDTIIVGRDPEILAVRPPPLGAIALDFFGLLAAPRSLLAMVRHAAGRLSAEEASYIPETEQFRVFRTARVWVAIYAAVVASAIASRSWLPLVLVGLPRWYGAWHHVLTGLTQHSGLAEDVTDHRLNTRSVRMNPISRFVYLDMNFHVEHHMYPMVPYHRLAELHAEIGHDLPPMSPSILAAYREFVPVLLRQRHDPALHVVRTLPLADTGGMSS